MTEGEVEEPKVPLTQDCTSRTLPPHYPRPTRLQRPRTPYRTPPSRGCSGGRNVKEGMERGTGRPPPLETEQNVDVEPEGVT